MWLFVAVNKKADGSSGWRTVLDAYSPRTLGWRLVFVCVDFVTVLLIDSEGGVR